MIYIARVRVLFMSLVLVACGARTPLGDLDDAGGVRGDDAGRARDAGPRPRPRDAGPVPVRGCEIAPPIEITPVDGAADYPTVAFIGDLGVVTVTQRTLEDRNRILAIPITPLGEPRGAPVPLGAGEGGTLLPRTLAEGERAFTLAWRGDPGNLAGARFDPDLTDVVVGGEGVPMDSRRPLLVITSDLVANGYEVVPGAPADGFVQDLRTRETTSLALGGTKPSGAVVEPSDQFRAATLIGDAAVVERFDASGRLLDRTTVMAPDDRFPIALGSVVIMDGTPLVVLAGGVIRALEQGYLAIVDPDGGPPSVVAPEGDTFSPDAAAAFDPASGWTAAAIGVLHDEGISRAPTPHVLVVTRAPAGAFTTDAFLPAGADLGRGEGIPRTAVAATGDPGTFLVVWTWNEPETGHVMAARVRCD